MGRAVARKKLVSRQAAQSESCPAPQAGRIWALGGEGLPGLKRIDIAVRRGTTRGLDSRCSRCRAERSSHAPAIESTGRAQQATPLRRYQPRSWTTEPIERRRMLPGRSLERPGPAVPPVSAARESGTGVARALGGVRSCRRNLAESDSHRQRTYGTARTRRRSGDLGRFLARRLSSAVQSLSSEEIPRNKMLGVLREQSI